MTLAEAEEKIAKLEAENRTLGEANKWLTYGIGAWAAGEKIWPEKLRLLVRTLVEYDQQCQRLAEERSEPDDRGNWHFYRGQALGFHIAAGQIHKLMSKSR